MVQKQRGYADIQVDNSNEVCDPVIENFEDLTDIFEFLDERDWEMNYNGTEAYFCVARKKRWNVKDVSSTLYVKSLVNFLKESFGDDYGGCAYYDHNIDGVEIWFKKKEDMLTFKYAMKMQKYYATQ